MYEEYILIFETPMIWEKNIKPRFHSAEVFPSFTRSRYVTTTSYRDLTGQIYLRWDVPVSVHSILHPVMRLTVVANLISG